MEGRIRHLEAPGRVAEIVEAASDGSVGVGLAS